MSDRKETMQRAAATPGNENYFVILETGHLDWRYPKTTLFTFGLLGGPRNTFVDRRIYTVRMEDGSEFCTDNFWPWGSPNTKADQRSIPRGTVVSEEILPPTSFHAETLKAS